MKTIVLIPAYNEQENIRKVLDELRRDFAEADVLVVNDCSSDHTQEIVENYPDVRIAAHPYNMGYAAALQTGFKYAVKYGYDYVIQFDGDGQHIAAEAKRIYLHTIATQSDLVIGSRFIEKTEYKNSFFRSIGSKYFSWLIHLLCKRRIYDPTSGMQVLRRGLFERLSKMREYPEYPDANLLIELIRSGVTISEIAVEMRQRESGTSMHGGFIKPVKYMFMMSYSIVIVLFRHFKQSKPKET